MTESCQCRAKAWDAPQKEETDRLKDVRYFHKDTENFWNNKVENVDRSVEMNIVSILMIISGH